MARFVVLDGGTADAARAVAAELAGELGVTVVEGWSSRAPAGSVRVGPVADATDAAAAVLAAVNGADLVVLARAERVVTDQLCDDLRRLGQLDHRVGAASAPTLTADERALLAQLVGGATLGEAARALHLSRRTADRRLASARRALGAGSTSEAMILARRHGVVAPD